MPAPPNNLPLWSRQGSISIDNGVVTTALMAQLKTAANNDYVGTHANAFLIWTADPNNGGLLECVIAKAGGANVGTVCRLYANNGGSNLVAANNALIGEMGLPPTAAWSNTATAEQVWKCGRVFDPGFRLFGCLGNAVAAGWAFQPWGTRY